MVILLDHCFAERPDVINTGLVALVEDNFHSSNFLYDEDINSNFLFNTPIDMHEILLYDMKMGNYIYKKNVVCLIIVWH